MEKINLVELLKDCPKGMELDCINYDGVVTFEGIINRDCYPIKISINYGNESSIHTLTKYGQTCNIPYCKCIIFPKGKNTWDGFQRPFKDGDILATDLGSVFLLNTRLNTDEHYGCYAGIDGNGSFYVCGPFVYKECCGFATEEEKQRLFQAIKDNGYKWNVQTKTLKLNIPNFNIGDIIQDKDSYKVKITAIDIEDRFYTYESLIAKGIGAITFKEQDDWELVTYQVGDHFIHPTDPKLFVITEIRGYGNYRIQNFRGSSYVINEHNLHEYLRVSKWNPKWFKPFDKVLVRDNQYATWIATLFSHIGDSEHYPYVTTYINTKYCIPYNIETKHLVGTTLEEPEFYKL